MFIGYNPALSEKYLVSEKSDI